MSDSAAQTAVVPMALVAIEQFFPEAQRILHDDLAYRMLPAYGKLLALSLRPAWARRYVVGRSEKTQPGLWGGLLCRKRYIDEKFAASRQLIQAVVNIGAGLDTRVYRQPAIAGLPVWEVDQPVNIEAKRKRLRGVLGGVPYHVRLVAIDFDHQNLAATLAAHGYAISLRTFFVCEAVTQYLTPQGLEALFSFLAMAAPASRLAFTYVRKDFLDGRALFGWQAGYDRFVRSGIWLSGFDPQALPGFLERFGWSLLEGQGYDEMADAFIKPSGRTLTATALERMVLAEKIAGPVVPKA